MLIAANKKDILALRPGPLASVHLVNIGDDVNVCIRCSTFQYGLFHRADNQGCIRGGNDCKFRTACLCRHASQGQAVLQFSQPFLPEIMKIHCIKNKLCVGAIPFQQGNVIGRNVMTADHYEIEFCTTLAEKIMQGFEPGVVNYFDASLLHIRGIAAGMPPVVGEKGDPVTEAVKTAQQVKQAKAAGILVRFRCIGVDDQYPSLQTVVPCFPQSAHIIGIGQSHRLPCQFVLPALEEFVAVDFLESFCATVDIGARCNSLVVHDGCPGLYTDFQALRTNAERQVGIFVIGRRIKRIEATEFMKQLCFEHDAGA